MSVPENRRQRVEHFEEQCEAYVRWLSYLIFLALLITSACTVSRTNLNSIQSGDSTPPGAALTLASTTAQTDTPTVITPAASPTLAQPAPTGTSIPTSTVTLPPPATPEPSIHFAVIGDYGEAGIGEREVSALVHAWNPDFIITVGDNNYPDGAAATIDQNIGQYYHDFIFPYKGSYGPGSKINCFFPTLGNADWQVASGHPNPQPYLDYFTLPGYERYYSFVWGPVEFFTIDSDYHDPAGIGATSPQATWLKNALAASTSAWKIVFFHVPPYSSGSVHGSAPELQWPFKQWGATAVLSGHDHLYERIIVDGFPYFIDGLGGNGRYSFQATPVPGSQVRYNSDYGAMRVTADSRSVTFEFINEQNQVIDTYAISK
jgi:tartrate-resistant acid phosphatase type 5